MGTLSWMVGAFASAAAPVATPVIVSVPVALLLPQAVTDSPTPASAITVKILLPCTCRPATLVPPDMCEQNLVLVWHVTGIGLGARPRSPSRLAPPGREPTAAGADAQGDDQHDAEHCDRCGCQRDGPVDAGVIHAGTNRPHGGRTGRAARGPTPRPRPGRRCRCGHRHPPTSRQLPRIPADHRHVPHRHLLRRRSGIDCPAAAAIGAPDLHFHDLRHTGNHFAASTGAGLKDLMARMGHDSERAAMIYLHETRRGSGHHGRYR